MNTKYKKIVLLLGKFTIFLLFFSFVFNSSAYAQINLSQVKNNFESFVDNFQTQGLSPFEIAVKTKNQMTQLIRESASKGFTLKEIAAFVEEATRGAVSGCKSKPSGYEYTPTNLQFKATCTARPDKPLGDCTALVLSMVEGAKIGASDVGMAVSHENRLINAIGNGSGGCVKPKVQKVRHLTPDEKDAIDESAEAARQLTLNVTSPKL